MIKGMDVSTLLELSELGAVYYDKRDREYVKREFLDILKSYGFTSLRLRLWHDPYTEDGIAYGAGTNDLERTIKMLHMAKDKGFSVLLSIHYSDFWADPGKQRKPKAWEGMDEEALERAVYDYTVSVMEAFRRENVLPEIVQVGNELSNGLLWPEGKRPNYSAIRRFVNAGIRGVRAVSDQTEIMLHLDNGGNNALYREWFDAFMDGGADFDYIGLSYYPFWHGSLEELSANMQDIALRYQKKLMIAEVSMGHTMEDYAEYEKLKKAERKGMATRAELAAKVSFPMTHQGQCDFMTALMDCIKAVPQDKGCGFYYWEGGWIPVAGSGWATPGALSYIKEAGPGGNEWANQAVFDYEGRILPVMQTIRDYR